MEVVLKAYTKVMLQFSVAFYKQSKFLVSFLYFLSFIFAVIRLRFLSDFIADRLTGLFLTSSDWKNVIDANNWQLDLKLDKNRDK